MIIAQVVDVIGVEESKNLIDNFFARISDWVIEKGLTLLLTLLFLYIGMKISKGIVKIIAKSFKRSNVDDSVSGFVLSLVKWALNIVVFIMAAAMLGFQVTSLVTILGAASLTIGLALQGSLANFAGGVLILTMKPFRVDDYILENDKGCEGTVISIDIFYTKLRTMDGKIVVIPNGNITANSIVNFSTSSERKLDMTIDVAYDSNVDFVSKVLLSILNQLEYSIKDQEMNVFISSFDASSIKMGIRCLVKTEDYWPAKWEVNKQIRKVFEENNIQIPFGQLDVKIKN